jgi:hypothetical protein
VLVLLLQGCATPRNGLNTSANACFRALPEAVSVLNGRGRLQGVRRVDDAFGTARPESSSTKRDACAFAFDGPYPAGSVAIAAPGTHGKYAIAVVTASHPRVLRVLLTDRLPIRFRHRV